MIEILVEGRSRDFFPARSRMARLAGLLEAAVMDIRMAVSALAKRDSCVTRLSVRTWRVAFLARDLRMHSCQRIARLGMVELLDRADRFPVGEVVALLAIGPQPALMRIFVTAGTSLWDAEEGLVQILDLDERAISGRNVFGGMAAITSEARVLRL